MTIRARLTVWYAVVIFVSLAIMGALTYEEFAPEPKVESREKVQDDENDMREVLRILFWCGVPAAALALSGGWWLMRKALKPVSTLTQAAERINDQNLGEQLPRSGNGDEFDRLTEVFNAMTTRLNGSFTRIREFTLHASHELKTPLTVLCGEAETALHDESLTTAQRERVASQLEELRRLGIIVDSLTLLAKADAGLIKLTMGPVRFDELVRDSFADTQILAHAPNIRVELEKCDEATVNGDAHRLRQMLLNLADNAVKYNQPNGQISMSLQRNGESVEFAIANSGPGVSRDVLPRVFDRFYRGDPAHSDAVDGCGLGLSIAQWIVSAHNGTIQMESEPSKLTTVTVCLPLTQERKTA